MTRYISVHWDARDHDSANRVTHIRNRLAQHLTHWTSIFERSGVLVFSPVHATPVKYVQTLGERSGVVLGTLFRRIPKSNATVRQVHSFTESESRRIHETRGRNLVSEFWGSYVAIFRDPIGSASHVLRGPFSSIKAFYSDYGPVRMFFSDVQDYADLELTAFAINWDCIRAQAGCADYLSHETALEGVLALEAGEYAQVLPPGVTREFYWHPCDIAQVTATDDFCEAAELVRDTTQGCVRSWAAHYEHIIHTLSGGLDSSISVCCARKALERSAMVGVNYFSEDPTGDERRFARDVARHVDVELVEQARDPNVNLDVFRTCALTSRPTLDFSGYGQYRKEVEFANRRGANAIFTGELGDNLFEHGAAIEAAADYVWRHGLRPGLLRVVVECAMRRNLSVWNVIYRLFKEHRFRRSSKRWNSHRYMERELGLRVSDLTLLRSDALESVRAHEDRFVHPWLDRMAETPPAKFMMIYGMYMETACESPFALADDPPMVAPLASQPIAEICLRIPSYLCNRYGMNRAVARRAFAGELPDSVLERATKGTPEPWTRDVVKRNQQFLRGFLLDGVLVKEGILDRARVESSLSSEVGASKVFIADLIVQLYIEAWLRRCLEHRSSMAA